MDQLAPLDVRQVLEEEASGEAHEQRVEVQPHAGLGAQEAHAEHEERDARVDELEEDEKHQGDDDPGADGPEEVPEEGRQTGRLGAAERGAGERVHGRERDDDDEVADDHDAQGRLADGSRGAGLADERERDRGREGREDDPHRQRDDGPLRERHLSEETHEGARRQHGERDERDARKQSPGAGSGDGAEATADPAEAQLAAGRQRDEPDGDAVDELQVAEHPLGHQVGDAGTHEEAAHQVAGQPRHVHSREEGAALHGREQDEAEREGRARPHERRLLRQERARGRDEHDEDGEQQRGADHEGTGSLSASVRPPRSRPMAWTPSSVSTAPPMTAVVIHGIAAACARSVP